MSMFIAGLAFGEGDASEDVLALARLGILMGTFVSAIIGYFLLKLTTKSNLMKAA